MSCPTVLNIQQNDLACLGASAGIFRQLAILMVICWLRLCGRKKEESTKVYRYSGYPSRNESIYYKNNMLGLYRFLRPHKTTTAPLLLKRENTILIAREGVRGLPAYYVNGVHSVGLPGIHCEEYMLYGYNSCW